MLECNILKLILETGFSRDDIIIMINEKQKCDESLSDEQALYLITRDFAVNIDE